MSKFGLDIGCGTAMLNQAHKGYPQFTWIGIDKADFTRFYPVSRFYRHDVIDYLPFANHSFGMIWCHHMLEHLPPIHPYAGRGFHLGAEDWLVWLVNEMWRVLEPGAQAHLIVPWNEHANSWRDPTHYRHMDASYFAWFDWTVMQAVHESAKLWSKWKVHRSDVVDQCHVYGILEALEWAPGEREAVVGPLSQDWKAIDLKKESHVPTITLQE